MSDAAVWTTRISPEITTTFGCDEHHAVFFQPKDDPGGCMEAVSFPIPETPPATVAEVLKSANKIKVRVAFFCDTAQQAAEVAEYATLALPEHRRVAYERAVAGAWRL